MGKYRAIFIDEATEHIAGIGSSLLELEKRPSDPEQIDDIFRRAHSIKGMAASLGYDSITEIAHGMEDRMQAIRAAGCVGGGEELGLLFRGLEALESMLTAVRTDGEAPPPRPELAAALADEVSPEGGEAKKKDLSSPPALSVASPRREPLEDAPTPTPPPSVRVKTQTLDHFLSAVGEVILSSSQLRASADTGRESKRLAGGLDRMDRVVGELQRRAVEMRTTPLLRILEPLPRVAREVAQLTDKCVEVEIRGVELDLDRSILDRLSDPLVHLVRNAVDHGIESPAERAASGKSEVGHVCIEARREKDSICISVSDDGAGIDLEAVRARAVEQGLVVLDLAEDLSPRDVAAFVFHPGITTARTVSRISGRGVGMDAVRVAIESLGGQVELTTESGVGTTTTLVVPVTAAVQSVLLVQTAGETLAIPIRKVERIVEVEADQIERSGTEAFVLIDDDPVPVFAVAEQLGLEARNVSGPLTLVLSAVRGERVALLVDRIAGQQQIYVKPSPSLLANVRAAAGLTILGDGRPVFLLDLNQLA